MKLITKLEHLKHFFTLINFFLIFIVLSSLAAALFLFLELGKEKNQIVALNQKVVSVNTELNKLKNQDQVKINNELKEKVKKTEDTYKKTVTSYEKILDLKVQKQNTDALDKLFTSVLNDLSTLNYSSASSKLSNLNLEITKKYATITAPASTSRTPTQASVISNSPPGSGYSFQSVKTDTGSFNVAIIAADLNSTKVIVDTASDGTCKDNCPVLPLGAYVSRSGAYAGINGSFFCPQDYPNCAGKINSFDTLVMNKNKVYMNSENNVYSTIPIAVFGSGWARFMGRTLDWGRDTGVDGVIANYPLYVSGGNVAHEGANDKFAARGARTFIANKGNFAYMGIVYSATSGEAAKALKTLGMDNAMGLDQGGSTALWFNGYKAGPGRSIPNAILFVRK